jgi:hypothetical protein
MIRYTLCCDKGHDFESWFRDSEAFDAQRKRKLVTCPVCHSPKVEKTIMAPQVARKDRGGLNGPLLPVDLPVNDVASPASTAPASTAPATTAPALLLGEKERELRAMIGEVREKILAVTDDVGDSFSREARAMAEGDTEERPIRGTATAQEWRDLVEDGIGVLPLPELPEDRH